MSNSDKAASPPADRVSRSPVALDDCGMARAVDVLGDRWTLLILREAFYGVARFEDIQADIGIPRAALSQRLDRLVEAGVLERVPYREGKSRTRYEYRPTPRGMDAALPVFALTQWGDTHLRADGPPIRMVEQETQEPLSLVLATGDGRVVPADKAELKILRRRKD